MNRPFPRAVTAAPRRITRPGLAAGFTLIELVIALAVVAILAAIAMPAYTDSVQRSRRAEATATLLQAAQWMERHRAENRGSYLNAVLPAHLQASPSPPGQALYTVAVDTATLTATTYRLTATPRTGTPMAGDACGVFTIDQTGQRTAAGGQTTGTPFTRCWRR